MHMPSYDEALELYVRTLFAQEEATFAQIRARTVAAGLPEIMIRPEEGRFLQFLVAVIGAQNALELGTLGGYSGTWIARGLPEGSRLVTVERDPERAEFAIRNFREVGLDDRVDVLVGDAHGMLSELSAEGPFDFIFVDAEKEGYVDYHTWAVQNLLKGGILAAHNALSRGAVADPDDQRERTKALRGFNERLASDPNFISLIFPAGDGIAFGWKKA
jgi:predicted O-methyltransferase YrrM